MPKSLVVMGSGAIGIEFASFYRTMGAEVTVIELLPQIMPVEDAEIAGLARKRFEKQGIKILTERQGRQGRKEADGVTAHETARRPQTDLGEQLISAVGVVATSRTSASRRSASRPSAARSSSTATARPTWPASTPSATSPARRCWRTRPSMKA